MVKGTYSWVTMSVVLRADILNTVLYNMDYSSVKRVPESCVLNQALRKFILPPLCPSPSPLLVHNCKWLSLCTSGTLLSVQL